MVFIDGSNLFWAQKRWRQLANRPDYKMDIKKLVNKLVGDRFLVRPYFYCAIGVPPSPQQVKFHQKLRYSGITVVTKPLKKRGNKWAEKGVDVALVTDMLGMAFRNAYDVAIVVSGDKDLEGAIEEVKRLGKRVEVASFEHSISEDTKLLADRFISIDKIMDEIRLEQQKEEKGFTKIL